MSRLRMPSTLAGVLTVTLALGSGLASAFLVTAPGADASSRGKVGYSGNPDTQGGATCANCHYGGREPTVTLDGPGILAPGSTGAYILTIAGGQRVAGGFNVSATRGLLDVLDGATDIQLVGNELTHTRPKGVNGQGEVLFGFLWQAPDLSGQVTLYGAGNSVDRNGQPSGDAPGLATLTVMVAQPTEPPPVTPSPYEMLFGNLRNPHGLSTVGPGAFLVTEGGTGDPVPGEFAPGNGDGRVQLLSPAGRQVIVDGLTNSQDPGGGVVGANHAIRVSVLEDGRPVTVTLVAQAGGPGHLRPEEAAKILRVDPDGSVTVLADTLAFEEAHNPGGESGVGAIDSNPWRLAWGPGDMIYIADAGANDVLKMDPVTGELSLYAVFAPIGESQSIPTGIVFDGSVGYVAQLGPMFSPQPASQIRRLADLNGDGDGLDEGENELLLGGLRTPTDLILGPFGQLYFLEMFPGTLSRLDTACWSPGAPCQEADRTVVATGLVAATAITWSDSLDAFAGTDTFAALVTSGPATPEGPSLRTDRILRVPFDQIRPEVTPTPTATVGWPTATRTPDYKAFELYLPLLENG